MTECVESVKEVKHQVIFDKRAVIPEVEKYLNENLSHLQSLDYFIDDIFDAEELTEALREDLPDGANLTYKMSFIQDIVHYVEQFFSLTESKKIRVQVEVVKNDMCRLFHVDHIRQRFLCTYIGPGTEWLDHDNVRREGLGKGCNDGIVKDYSKVRKAKPFEALILKGLLYGEHDLAVPHRSPPVEKDFKTRVLLKIDEC